MLTTSDIRIRDPFVLLHDGVYYLYGTIGEPKARELYVHTSRDLATWEGPFTVYTLREDSWATGELWAPEVHAYRGRYYLFLSLLGRDGYRATEISVADSPMGPFLPLTNAPATPTGMSCIDGTLYVEDGVPYIVYSHDWPDRYDEAEGAYIGAIGAQALSEDLMTPVGEPFLLFDSKEAPLSGKHPTHCRWGGRDIVRYGSDAPFLSRREDGRVLLLWSPIPDGNYVVLGAVADSIRGPWRHLDAPIFDKDGGHPMLFTDAEGVERLALHQPNTYWQEHPAFLRFCEENGRFFTEN